MLLAIGLMWPKLKLSPRMAQIAFWTLIYSTLAILAAYTIAAFWGVGIETIRLIGELPHGLSQGSPFQEKFIKVLAYPSAPTGLIAFALMMLNPQRTDPQVEHDTKEFPEFGMRVLEVMRQPMEDKVVTFSAQKGR
jgi:hydroxylaminobenzene mutase